MSTTSLLAKRLSATGTIEDDEEETLDDLSEENRRRLAKPKLVRMSSVPLGIRCMLCSNTASCRVIQGGSTKPEGILLCRSCERSESRKYNLYRTRACYFLGENLSGARRDENRSREYKSILKAFQFSSVVNYLDSKIAKYMNGFLNSVGGVIYFGVDEVRQVKKKDVDEKCVLDSKNASCREKRSDFEVDMDRFLLNPSESWMKESLDASKRALVRRGNRVEGAIFCAEDRKRTRRAVEICAKRMCPSVHPHRYHVVFVPVVLNVTSSPSSFDESSTLEEKTRAFDMPDPQSIPLLGKSTSSCEDRAMVRPKCLEDAFVLEIHVMPPPRDSILYTIRSPRCFVSIAQAWVRHEESTFQLNAHDLAERLGKLAIVSPLQFEPIRAYKKILASGAFDERRSKTEMKRLKSANEVLGLVRKVMYPMCPSDPCDPERRAASVRAASFMLMIGPKGCGKTILMAKLVLDSDAMNIRQRTSSSWVEGSSSSSSSNGSGRRGCWNSSTTKYSDSDADGVAGGGTSWSSSTVPDVEPGRAFVTADIAAKVTCFVCKHMFKTRRIFRQHLDSLTLRCPIFKGSSLKYDEVIRRGRRKEKEQKKERRRKARRVSKTNKKTPLANHLDNGQIVAQNLGPQERIDILAYHFCDESRSITLDVSRFVRSIAAQIVESETEAGRLARQLMCGSSVEKALSEDYCEDNPDAAFEVGVLAPLRSLQFQTRRFAMIVDGLDESMLAIFGEHDGGSRCTSPLSFDSDLDNAVSPASSVASSIDAHYSTPRRDRSESFTWKSQSIAQLLAKSLSQFPKWLTLIGTSRVDHRILELFDPAAKMSKFVDRASRPRYLLDMTSRALTTHFSECGRRRRASSPMEKSRNEDFHSLVSRQHATSALGTEVLRTAIRGESTGIIIRRLVMRERERSRQKELALQETIRVLRQKNRELEDTVAALRKGYVLE